MSNKKNTNSYEDIKNLEREYEKYKQDNKKSRLFQRVTLSLMMLLSISVLSLAILIELSSDKKFEYYFSKNIKTTISSSIRNGAGLNVVKHIYNTKKIERNKFYPLSVIKKDNVYPLETTLLIVLNDILVDCYNSKNKNSQFISSVETIINQHLEINPFDKLHGNQKSIFDNIRTKLDTSYTIVQSDIDKLSSELYSQNLLVERYLNRSELSYWISIFALVLTTILSIIQIVQNSKLKTNPKE